MKKKVCSKCRAFVEGDKCQICGGTDFIQTWKGRVFIINVEKSEVAKKGGFNKEGEYAIKIK